MQVCGRVERADRQNIFHIREAMPVAASELASSSLRPLSDALFAAVNRERTTAAAPERPDHLTSSSFALRVVFTASSQLTLTRCARTFTLDHAVAPSSITRVFRSRARRAVRDAHRPRHCDVVLVIIRRAVSSLDRCAPPGARGSRQRRLRPPGAGRRRA
jgi:hypothetical protein